MAEPGNRSCSSVRGRRDGQLRCLKVPLSHVDRFRIHQQLLIRCIDLRVAATQGMQRSLRAQRLRRLAMHEHR